MSAPVRHSRARLRSARRRLISATLARALLWVALSVVLAGGAVLAIDILVGLTVNARAWLVAAPWLTAFAVLAWQLAKPIRAALRVSDESLALWFERRIPSLRYALVTSTGLADDPRAEALEQVVAASPLEQEVGLATRRALARPALALALLIALVLLLPDGAVGRVTTPAEGDALDRLGAGAGATIDPLAIIVVRVASPAYSGLAVKSYDDPASVAALVGSRVTIEGRGTGVRAVRGTMTDAAATVGDRWRITLPVPPSAEAVRLTAGPRERVLVLEPIIDSVPIVRLDAPARDTVLREATGTIELAADIRDNLGIADGYFEMVISSGGGELYSFRTVKLAEKRFGAGLRRGQISSRVRLDSLRLKPGDLVHLRALATDRNDLAGAGRGASETRTLRIARSDEYDSVSVDPAPPSEPEKDALSQRMILQQTQELVTRRALLSPQAYTNQSRRIAVDQTKLRKRVGEVVFTRLTENSGGEHEHFPGDGHAGVADGAVNADALLARAEAAANIDPTRNLDNHGDETPVVAINRPLLEAYNHMWRASEELELGAPERAVPWMQHAIEALQRARAAERIYLRGRPPRVVVDLNRVRLAGKDEARPEARVPRAAMDPARAARLARFDLALGVVARDPAAAADSLLLIRVSLPNEERAAALTLDAAAIALRKGGEVTMQLVAARRALVQDPPRRAPLSAWGL